MATNAGVPQSIDERIDALLGEMTLAEKIGQMSQLPASGGWVSDDLRHAIQSGQVGSVLNEVDLDTNNELQRIAHQESRLGIPLLIGRDVIHGFKTVFPIPLGQAASWNPDIVRDGARVAAAEAVTTGVNWTFAPMIDITRDPRWGRIAESLGEDPHLAGILGAAMVEGFQGDDLAHNDTIAACAKHFAGYGASESGRDYNTTNLPENELRNVYLRPFEAALDAGVATFMASFSDLDGIPASANEFLMQSVLRDEWRFEGFVVSDWDSIRQLAIHGLTEGDRESAEAAVTAGLDMEMASTTYRDHLEYLVADGSVAEAIIDTRVRGVLRTKFALGLFEDPFTNPEQHAPVASTAFLDVARRAATESVVLLKNDGPVLPLAREELKRVAVIGPLADAPYEQLGTWIFDGDANLSVTPLAALRDMLGDDVELWHVPTIDTTRSWNYEKFGEARHAAEESDAVVLFLGEESILSGEAHCRADIDLPGNQAHLVGEVRAAGKPVIAVILAGRPLTLTNIVDQVDAILYAWHPGTMAGPAIADLLFGVESPSGKLPVTFPRMVGQIPILLRAQEHRQAAGRARHRAHRRVSIRTRRRPRSACRHSISMPASRRSIRSGMASRIPDFTYSDLTLSAGEIRIGDTLTAHVRLKNQGDVEATEIVQLYIRDLVGSVTRPVKELKGFERVRLAPGEIRDVRFELHTDDLAFYGRDMRLATEPGTFHLWIGGSSAEAVG